MSNEDHESSLTCALCGAPIDEDHYTVLDDQVLCEACLEENTLLCAACGERIWSDDNEGDTDTPLCSRCYDRDYTNCDHCGRLIRFSDAYYVDDDDDSPLCWECYSRSEANLIHDYSYKPDPIFYGDGSRYFGVELEIDRGGENGTNAKAVLDLANGTDELIYCKHDGSLDCGFEIVTHPMTYPFHKDHMPWQAILSTAADMGYVSHQSGTCGLHVHVNRSCFGATQEEQDVCIARILYFFEDHWQELLRFSRRTENQLKRWAARYGYKEEPREILDHAKKGYHGGRYTCVNLTNYDTIEFRIFRGTLRYTTLIATMQLLSELCDAAILLSDEEMKRLSWSGFVSGLSQEQYPELIQYLKGRRLYVNDPAAEEAEL
jgi:hypothetical protein